jgi:hypothetical protein
MDKREPIAVHCNQCAAVEVHDALKERVRTEEEVVDEGRHALDHEITTTLLECQRCKTWQIKVTKYSQPTEWWSESFIPPHPRRPWPRWATDLPPNMAAVLRQVHQALDAGHDWLVAMGARTLIDMFVLERIGDAGTFTAKLKRLQEEGYASSKDALIIETALNVGHDAAHSVKAPSQQSCMDLLDVVENVIQRLTLGEPASRLSENHPARERPRRPKKP